MRCRKIKPFTGRSLKIRDVIGIVWSNLELYSASCVPYNDPRAAIVSIQLQLKIIRMLYFIIKFKLLYHLAVEFGDV